MHWLIYLVLAVGMVGVVIVDLASERWARAGASLLALVCLGVAAWNRREDERKRRDAQLGARNPDTPRA